ncbi:MAG: hypothetical protein JJ891_06930 [Rhizobiaceae bacterium]|nr:hypothetical protein [Rhizobiaceae bacterium]
MTSPKDLLPIPTVLALAPQTRLVYDVLSSGRILTGLIAMTTLSVSSLTSRISELRAAGLDIQTEMARDHNGKRYKKYWCNAARHPDRILPHD